MRFLFFLKNNQRLLDFFFIALVLCIYGELSLWLGQDAHGDVWNYHLYNGWSYLHNRLDWDLAPAGAHSFLNPYLDVLFFKLVTTLEGSVYCFVIGAVHGLIVVPVLLIVRHLLSKHYLLSYPVSALCCFGSVFYIGCLGLSTHDDLITIFVLFSFYFLIRFLESYKLYFALFSAIILGLSVGLKLTAATYALAFCSLILIFVTGGVGRKIKISFYYGCTLLIGAIISTGLWCYRLYVDYDNPLFPFYNNIFKSPLASLDGAATQAMYFFQQKGLEHIFYPFFFADNPQRVASSTSEFIIYLPVFTIIACWTALCVFYSKKNRSIDDKKILFCSVFLVTSYVIWQFIFGVYRYFLPTDILLPLFLFLFINYSISAREDFLKPCRKLFVLIFLCALVCYQIAGGIPGWGRGAILSPYYSGNVPDELKKADVIFLGSYPSAWLVPVIEPQGHVICVGDVFLNFYSQEYKSRYFEIPQRKSVFIIFDTHLQFDKSRVEERLAFYKLKIDWSSKKTFETRLSSYHRPQDYYRLVLMN